MIHEIDTPISPETASKTRKRFSQDSDTMARNRAEEPKLIKAWQKNGSDAALTTLIERYKPMIHSQIKKIIAGRSVGPAHRQDLEQEATLAFIQAVSTFDPRVGTPLSSFAITHVRKTLLRYALDFRHGYRIGTSSNERKAFYAALTRRAQRIHEGKSEMLTPEDIAEIQEATGASRQSTQRAVNSIYATSTSVEDAPDLSDQRGSDDTESTISMNAAMEALAPFLESLDERQKAIFQSYLSEEDLSAQDLADRFGVTPERIGQIRRDMLADMAFFLKKHGIQASDLF